MPNWVTNEITSPDIDKIREMMGEEVFDFGKIVPMPKEVEDEGWYEWSCDNWGTKWNACDPENSDDAIYFETAWSTPYAAIKALSEKLQIEVSVRYADEDTGNNVGYYTFVNGEVTEEEELSETKEGYELCFELKGGEEFWSFNEKLGRYEYFDEYEED